ncbi:MAG: glycoside-pentoside-hexuronide (GPH):cation symporter [Lachnospiraceae bacterium]|nr:glycoside-pentoside-hexuronide (GPH):cation symporter [Lachnospiraceae bacterium]
MSDTNNSMNNANVKLSWLERIGYGAGDYAGNLVYSAISAFLLVYYTNVIGASAAAAASIIAVSKIFDGISDLIMGYIVDHTHSKWGKARPWIARLCVPLAVCTVLMFTVPASFAGTTQIVYMFLTYNLVSTVFYTGVNVPYATMNGLMTTNQYERGLLGNFRNLFATAGTMTINTVVLKMTSAFGGGDPYNQQGWTITVAILMVAFVAINMFMFFTCKERVTKAPVEDEKSAQKVSFAKGIKDLFLNKYWVYMVVAIFAMYFMMSCFFGSAVYFAQYVLGDANYYTPISNYLSLAQIVTLFITPFIMKKIGKRNTFAIGMCISVVGFAATGFATTVGAVSALSIIKGIGFGFGGATMYGMLQDAITYGEWQSGYNNAGMGNAASSFCMKVGSGIGTAALGWILAAGAFDAKQAVQSAAAIGAIQWSFVWVPAISMAVAAVFVFLFDLDKHYDQVVADLAVGKYKEK